VVLKHTELCHPNNKRQGPLHNISKKSKGIKSIKIVQKTRGTLANHLDRSPYSSSLRIVSKESLPLSSSRKLPTNALATDNGRLCVSSSMSRKDGFLMIDRTREVRVPVVVFTRRIDGVGVGGETAVSSLMIAICRRGRGGGGRPIGGEDGFEDGNRGLLLVILF